MRCGYCHNAPLVFGKLEDEELVGLEETFSFLRSKRNFINALVISGGEPLMSERLVHLLIEFAKDLGLLVKLDTNGLFFEKLSKILNSKDLMPTMVALDLKTTPLRYNELTKLKSPHLALLKTLELLDKKAKDGLSVEYRSVLVPTLTEEEDVRVMAGILPKNAIWRLARFNPATCLDPNFENILPFSEEKTQLLLKIAQSFVSDTKIR